MKILLITPVWGYLGGLERYIVDCLEEFTRTGHVCSIVYHRKSNRPVQNNITTLLHSDYQISALSEFESDSDALEVKRLNTILQGERPDVIFMTDVRNYALLSCLRNYGGLVPMSHSNSLLCMKGTNTTYFRRKICTHTLGYRCLLHGCFLRKNRAGGGGLIYNSLAKHQALLSIYKSMDVHLVASNYMKHRLIQHGFRSEQVRVVGYFTNLQPPSDLTRNDDEPSIMFSGRIDRYKGVDYLMSALAQLSTPFRCSIVGDGDYLPHCKKLADNLGLTDRVNFLGWLSKDEIVSRIRGSSLIVVPSIWPEAFGIVGIEAMICSRPVVAFDTGGISDWLKDGRNGYLVPVKNTKLLAERMELLLRDPERAATMGAEGYRIVTSIFSKDQHFKHLSSVFEEAAIRKAHQPVTMTNAIPAVHTRIH